METNKQTFRKPERLCSKRLIDELFAGGSKSLSAYPLRMVFRQVAQEDSVPASVLISVPKRRIKHAVDRNRVKRQVREAYRQHKAIVWQAMDGRTDAESRPQMLTVAFLWIADELFPSPIVEAKVKILLNRMAETIAQEQTSEA